jgi:uncharacterized protein (DUF736 family)
MNEKKFSYEIGALWKKINEQTGEEFFTGEVTFNVRVVPNKFRTTDKHPSHKIFISLKEIKSKNDTEPFFES